MSQQVCFQIHPQPVSLFTFASSPRGFHEGIPIWKQILEIHVATLLPYTKNTKRLKIQYLTDTGLLNGHSHCPDVILNFAKGK